MKKYLYLFLLLIIFKNFCYSQQVSFLHYSVNEGLSTNFVNSICQDKKGFLWIGTENGLQRYDGNNFVSVNATNPAKRLPGLPVDELLSDAQRNVIWVRMGTTIGRFFTDKGEFIQAGISLKLLPNGGVALLLKRDSKNHIILTIGDAGVFVFNDKKNIFEENDDVVAIPENFSVYNIFEDAKRGWFYLCGNEGLKIYDPQHKLFYDANNNPFHLPELNAAKDISYVLYAYRDAKNRFWIYSWPPQKAAGVYLLNGRNNKAQLIPVHENTPAYSENYGMYESNGYLFCYGLNLLNVYDEEKKEFINSFSGNGNNKGIQFSTAKKLYEDDDHNLWIITDQGLYQPILDNNFKTQGSLDALKGAPINCLLPLPGNYVLCGSWGKGFTSIQYNNTNLKIKPDEAPVRNINVHDAGQFKRDIGVWDALYDTAKHEIEAGCQAGILVRYNTITHKAAYSKPEAFEGSTIRVITKDNNGNKWYGFHSGKVIKEENGVYKVIKDYNRAFITKLFIDRRGLLWVCTAGFGIQVINPQTNQVVTTYNHQNNNESIASNEVGDILQFNDSVFIIALVKNMDVINIKSNTIRHITTDDGLPNNTVFSLVKDKHNNIWMTTNDGIVKFVYPKNEFHQYTKKDGLITINSNDDLLYKGCRVGENYLMFGGEKSNYIIFNPDSIGNRKMPKDAAITDIRLFNTYLPVDSILQSGGLNLAYDKNTVTINFTALTYGSANTLSYYYRLKGASDEWVRALRPYSASYASLSPGDYTFEVRCVNEDGVPSKNITSLPVNISKPYWQTWWFITLMIIAACIPVYIIYRLRINRFKEVQKIREKVARDLHDDVGSTLTSINILSEFSKSKVDDNSEVKDYLNRISSTSSQMMDAMDDIVWNIKPANDTMDKIEARMREYAASVFEPKDIIYKFLNDEKVKNISLNMDVRRSLFLIFKETLNNIAKYANARLVTIEFELQQTQLTLIIIDDGIGFDEAKIVYGNGIENMKKRTRSFNGNYNIRSYPGRGTHVSLTIPLRKYYT